jgi:hypothetical protein
MLDRSAAAGHDSDGHPLGIEEEYLLVDRETGALAEAPEDLMEACAAKLEGQVSPEFLQCQIEIGTRVCADIGAARRDLRRLRATVARTARRSSASRPSRSPATPSPTGRRSTTPTRTATTSSPAISAACAADADLRHARACRPARPRPCAST